jgi:hypothetical protein
MLCSESRYNLQFQVYVGKIWNKTETWLVQRVVLDLMNGIDECIWMSLLLSSLYLCFWYCTNVLLCNALITIPTASCYCISSFHLGFLFHVSVNPSLSVYASRGWVTSPSPSTDTMFSLILQLWPAPLGGPTLSNASASIALGITDTQALPPRQGEAWSGV